MQKIDRRSQSMQRDLTARDSAASAADAREVIDLYRLMAEFFSKRADATDAVKFSKDGAELAEAVVISLQGNDLEAASRSATSITRACRDCHFKYKPLEP
jgi:hypothetical protein